jgi:hypothetical protein
MREPEGLGLRERFDQRREVSAGIGEEVLNAAIGHQGEIGVRYGHVFERLDRHRDLPVV